MLSDNLGYYVVYYILYYVLYKVINYFKET
jgi:hypothetical protein